MMRRQWAISFSDLLLIGVTLILLRSQVVAIGAGNWVALLFAVQHGCLSALIVQRRRFPGKLPQPVERPHRSGLARRSAPPHRRRRGAAHARPCLPGLRPPRSLPPLPRPLVTRLASRSLPRRLVGLPVLGRTIGIPRRPALVDQLAQLVVGELLVPGLLV